ncbi:trehalose import ATP-binding protein SugC [Desulfosarcina ovata subsp. sediminis]|uniref:Trehalose import ATP-binding protein SugC n=1 Tax=Desulfosarcina ovata subsp. sediminis TaxID=885957 RepID=A0A5K7ZS11_9BACT|nr:sn-glycerol-3-phosphate ABC transporter ATP-binding protein UgpC [Desulfosarcina ovata]BBO82998.1 trehalose import ATP-binding protein SugC [Desulfosarcina ovata subsp. sediminis]
MADISFRGVNKIYPNGFKAVHDLDLAIDDGEFLVMVGPSGCGKSTTLRMLAGLEAISSGDLLIAGERVNDLHPRTRNIAMVFQSYALYPHKTVQGNIEFPLRMAKIPAAEVKRRAIKVARMLELEPLLERKPALLSGGQRQRVAMARALVRDPVAFLMDEPLSNLDAKLRVQMRAEIAALQRRTGTTTVYVTHDQVEAMTMGDRVAVFNNGRLQQVATPQELFERPVNTFVAGFIGSPSMNLIDAHIDSSGDGLVLTLAGQRIQLGSGLDSRFAPSGRLAGAVAQAGLRPEDVVDPHQAGEGQRIGGRVAMTELLGREQMVYLDLADGTRVVARLPAEQRLHRGEEIAIGIDPSRLYLFGEDGRALDGR